MSNIQINRYNFETVDRGWALIIGLTLFRLLYIGFAPVTEQESYYWLWSQHLALSYVDHPPMVAWSIFGGTVLFGDNSFGIKFMAVIWSLLSNILLYHMTRRAFSELPEKEARQNGYLALLLLNLTLFAHFFAVTQQPDTPLLFFWLLVLYFIQEFRLTGRSRHFIFAGVALGLALLSKYTAVAIVPGILLALLLDDKCRRSLLTPWPYLAMVIALLALTPVVYWNWQNDWISFTMQLKNRTDAAVGGGIQLINFPALLATQLGMLTPLVFVLFFRDGIVMLREWRSRQAVYLSFCSSLFLIGGFAVICLTSEVKFYWLVPAYLGLIISTVMLFSTSLTFQSKWFARGAWCSVLIIGLFYIAYAAPILQVSQLKSWSGWKSFAGQVLILQQQLGGEEKVFIFTDSHKTAAYITLNSPDHQRTYAHNIVGLFAKQFSAWSIPQTLKGKSGLYVSLKSELSPAERTLLERYFDQVEAVGVFNFPNDNQPTRTVYGFLGTNYSLKPNNNN